MARYHGHLSLIVDVMLRDTSKPRHILTADISKSDAFLVSFPEFEYARALGDTHIVCEVEQVVRDPFERCEDVLIEVDSCATRSVWPHRSHKVS